MIMIQRHARVLTYVDIKPAFELRAYALGGLSGHLPNCCITDKHAIELRLQWIADTNIRGFCTIE